MTMSQTGDWNDIRNIYSNLLLHAHYAENNNLGININRLGQICEEAATIKFNKLTKDLGLIVQGFFIKTCSERILHFYYIF